MKQEFPDQEIGMYTEAGLNIAREVQEETLLDLIRQRDEAMDRCQHLSGKELDNESDLVVKIDKEIRRVQNLVKNTRVNLNYIRSGENGNQIGG